MIDRYQVFFSNRVYYKEHMQYSSEDSRVLISSGHVGINIKYYNRSYWFGGTQILKFHSSKLSGVISGRLIERTTYSSKALEDFYKTLIQIL